MQVFTAHSRPTKSECLKLGHRNMGFKNLPFRWLWCTSRLENYSSGIKENLLNGILQQCSRLCFPIPFHGMNCLKVCPRLNSLWYQDSENQNNCHSVRPSDRSELHSKGSLSAASIEFKKYLFIFGCTGPFLLFGLSSSCREWGQCLWGLLSSGASHCSGFSLESTGSVIVAHRPSCPAACGVSQTRDWACVPCAGRQILSHWITRKVCLSGVLTLTIFQSFFPLHFMFQRQI